MIAHKTTRKMLCGLTGLVALSAGLAACTTGNERDYLGNGDPANTVKLAAFRDTGETPPRSDDARSLTSLSRASWQTTTVLVPIDGLAQKPIYAKSHLWATETARQRGQQPSDLTALELDGDTGWTQVAETAASPFLALWDSTRFVFYDAWFTPPWEETIEPLRTPRGDGYQRAGMDALRVPSTSDSAGAAR